MKYIKKDIYGNVEAASEVKFDETYELANEDYDVGFDGKIYSASEMQALDYLTRKAEFDNEIKLNNELVDLENWFTMYDNQIKQYQRCSRLNLSYDNKYGTIEELDEQAALKAARISEIRKLLSDT